MQINLINSLAVFFTNGIRLSQVNVRSLLYGRSYTLILVTNCYISTESLYLNLIVLPCASNGHITNSNTST